MFKGMKTYIFEGTLTALSSIAHGGERRGITTLFNREKILQPSGEVELVAMLTGNSIRGSMRDYAMLHLLNALGYDTQDGNKLDLNTYYFFMSGGVLDKTGSRGLDIDLARQWRELVPPVSLFGAAVGNQTLPGKLDVGKGIPICQETACILPERYTAKYPLKSIWELSQREAYVRKDDAKDDNLRGLLEAGYRNLLEAKVKAERERARSDELIAEPPGQKQQMRYFIETLCAGTEFYWRVCLRDPTEVEFDAFAVMIAEWAAKSSLGGCRGKGHGQFGLRFDHWLQLDPRKGLSGTEVDRPIGTSYEKHLRDNADVIRMRIEEAKISSVVK